MTELTKCILCFNEIDDESESVSCYPSKLPELFCKYLHSSLTQEILLCQSNHHNLSFCPKCCKSVVELGNLNDELEFYQKRISEFVFILSLEILHRRGNSKNSLNKSNHRNSKRKLIEFDISALPNCDFKKNTPVRSEEIEASAQGDRDFSSEDVHDPLLIPSSTPNANTVEVTLEDIKVDIDKHNWNDDETHDEINETADFLIENTKQISTGQTGNKELIPLLKLQRLNFHGGDRKVILIESDKDNLNGSSESECKKSQTVWTKSDFGSSFKITDVKISTSENCSLQIPSISTINSVPVSSSNLQIFTEKDDLEKQNCYLDLDQSLSRTFECRTCDKTLSTEQELEVHAARHSSESQYNSDVGEKMFETKDKSAIGNIRFKSPEMVQRKGKLFNCEVCGKGFCCQCLLIAHRRIHIGERPLKCEVCGKGCSSKSLLITHRRIHTGERPFKCDVCGKGFIQYGHLSAHYKIHTGEKPYQCEVCGKGFRQQGTFERHGKIHTGEKPFKCDVCGKGFLRKISLIKHRCPKGAISQNKCNESGGTPDFNYDLDLGENKSLNNLRVHKKRLQFKKQLSVSKQRQYKCGLCYLKFSLHRDMITHQTSHNAKKPFNCDECSYASNFSGNLSKHKSYRHSSLKKFKCRECKKDFKTKDLVKQHYKRVHFALEYSYDCIVKNT